MSDPPNERTACELSLEGAASGGWAAYACPCGHRTRERRGDRPECPLALPAISPVMDAAEARLEGMAAPQPHMRPPGGRGQPAHVDSPNAGSGVEIPISDLSGAPKFAENGNYAAPDVRGTLLHGLGTTQSMPEPIGTRIFRLGALCERSDCRCRPLDNAEVVGPGVPPLHEGCDCIIEAVPTPPADFAAAARARGRDVQEAPNQTLVNALHRAGKMEAVLIAAKFEDGYVAVSWSDCDVEMSTSLGRAAGLAADQRLIDDCMDVDGDDGGNGPTG